MMLRSLQLASSLLCSLLFVKSLIFHSDSTLQFIYDGNFTIINDYNYTTVFNVTGNPVAIAIQNYSDEFHSWFFEVHYLSICAGYLGGTEDPIYYHLNCSARTGGFTFRADDQFILDYQSISDSFPVLPNTVNRTFNMGPSFATLVVGIVLTIAGAGTLVLELCGFGHRWKFLDTLSAGLILVSPPGCWTDLAHLTDN